MKLSGKIYDQKTARGKLSFGITWSFLLITVGMILCYAGDLIMKLLQKYGDEASPAERVGIILFTWPLILPLLFGIFFLVNGAIFFIATIRIVLKSHSEKISDFH